MKNIKLSLVALMSIGSMAFAGGAIEAPMEIMEENTPSVVSEYGDFYVGLGLAAISARESGSSLNFFNVEPGQDRLGNVAVLAGYDINEYLAIEAKYTTTLFKKDVSKMSGFSIFAKPQYEVSEEVSVYALLGFGTVKLENSNASSHVDVDDSGFQWGLGAKYNVLENVAIFVDYTSLGNDMDGRFITASNADVDAITVGLTYRF